MRDIFAARARQSFADVFDLFVASLVELFPPTDTVWTWPDADARVSTPEEWTDVMMTALPKGCAKYAKAVTSITNAPACVYHGVAYRDPTAVQSCDYFARLHVADKVSALTSEQRTLFWQYLDELNTQAFVATRRKCPCVPTSDDIRTNIQRRKQTGPVLQHGIAEVWRTLCRARGAEAPASEESLSQRLHAASEALCGEGVTVGELCRARDMRGFDALVTTFPYLGTAPPSDEEWSLLVKALSLSTMNGNIPAPMMRGIEKVANELVSDIHSGKASLETLNVESIGQKVLASVGTDDMNSFAKNLDKILPSMRNV
jgi:hypothetical protein